MRRSLASILNISALSILFLFLTILFFPTFTQVKAQVPPHYPGQVCFTPSFWCPANPPGPPGTPCICLSATGYVGGVRG